MSEKPISSDALYCPFCKEHVMPRIRSNHDRLSSAKSCDECGNIIKSRLINQLRADLEAARKKLKVQIQLNEAQLSPEAHQMRHGALIERAKQLESYNRELESENAALKKRIEELEHDRETDEIIDSLKDGGPRG